MSPTLSGREVLENATFQELALYAREDNSAGLASKADVLRAMDVEYVRWLVLPAIKSGGTCALYALGDAVWADPAFREDMRKYAGVVGNKGAVEFLNKMAGGEVV